MLQNVLLVIHLMLAIALVGVILIQRSEGGGLGMGGGNSGGFMTTRGTANLLTRTTGTLAGLFMLTSLTLGYIAAHSHAPARSIFEPAPVGAPAPAAPTQTAPQPAAPPSGAATPAQGSTQGQTQAPATPEEPAKPSVPIVR